MPNIIEMPVDRLSDHELSIRKWEAVMSDGYGSGEYQRLERETARRMSGRDDSRGALTRH
jgi:hypothetical protein